MERRTFTALGAAVAAQAAVLPRTAIGAFAASHEPIDLTNGENRLELVKGPKGYGIAVYTKQNGKEVLAAHTTTPVRVFYDRRSAGPATEVAFAKAKKDHGALVALTSFTDSKQNEWQARLTVQRADNSGFQCHFDYELMDGLAANVFLEHPMTPAMSGDTEQTYVLMPGILYDGNRQTKTPNQIPQLTYVEDFMVDIPVLSLSTPVTAFQDKQNGLTFMYATEPTTDLDIDIAGFHCVSHPDAMQISVTAPCYREKHYYHYTYKPQDPQGAHVDESRQYRVTVTYFAGVYPDRLALFRALAPIRQFVRQPFTRNNTLPLSAAAHLVETNENERQWCDDMGFYINAMPPDYSIADNGCHSLPNDWQLQTGWCGGSIAGYTYLKMGDATSQQRARRMLDLVATGGLSPSGLLWSNYASGKWDPIENNDEYYKHLRMPADAAFYFQKAIALEKERGNEHPQWVAAVVSNLDAFVRLWDKNNEFGHKIDRNTLAITDPGTAAGALCIAGLAMGSHLPHGTDYMRVAQAAADAFYDQFVRTGWIVGGPLDIPNAPDSESPFALLESYITLYEIAHDPKYLRYAQETAYHVATWVVAYNAPFPKSSMADRLGIQTVGGVLANAQNHHIGPSFATNSGSALLRLYQYTGESQWLQLLSDVVSGLPQYICTGQVAYKAMKPGMITEQINMSDEIRPRGTVWEISASWSAHCVLLSYAELPSIYVDAANQTLGILDQVQATADWTAHTLRVSNPTTYPATVRVARHTGESQTITLDPQATQTLGL